MGGDPRSGALLTSAQVAARLGVTARWVRELAGRGQLPAVHPFGTRTLRYDPVLIDLIACGSWTPRAA